VPLTLSLLSVRTRLNMPAVHSCFYKEDSSESKRVLDKFLRAKGFQPREPCTAEVRVITDRGVEVTAQDCGYHALRESCRLQGHSLICRPVPGLSAEQQAGLNGIPSVAVMRWLAAHFAVAVVEDTANVFHAVASKFMDEEVLALKGPYTREFLRSRWQQCTQSTGARRTVPLSCQPRVPFVSFYCLLHSSLSLVLPRWCVTVVSDALETNMQVQWTAWLF
jgi:hypothetical protein